MSPAPKSPTEGQASAPVTFLPFSKSTLVSTYKQQRMMEAMRFCKEHAGCCLAELGENERLVYVAKVHDLDLAEFLAFCDNYEASRPEELG